MHSPYLPQNKFIVHFKQKTDIFNPFLRNSVYASKERQETSICFSKPSITVSVDDRLHMEWYWQNCSKSRKL